ncbi:14971_t:CDS:1, partial [Cetraspora pellucida]
MNTKQFNTYNNYISVLNNFEYMLEDYKDTKATSLNIESEDAITESIITDRLDFDIKLKPFSFDDISFNKAYEFAEAKEKKNINILRKNNNTNININSNNIVVLNSEFKLNNKN